MNKFLKSLTRIKLSKGLIPNLPEEAGIYIFWGEVNTSSDAHELKPIYIGKAKNLKNRISSYFNLRLAPKTYQMVNSATELSNVRVNSELESLLLEAYLIRTFQPHFNSEAKDDKHPLYIKITAEEFPRVITVRKLDAKQGKKESVFGPFPSSTNVRSVLHMLRRIFPFSDHKLGKRACIESHIGLCDPCPNKIIAETDPEARERMTKKYKSNIRMVKNVLGRQINKVTKELTSEMANYSKIQMYEKAKEAREKLERLNYITQPIIPKEEFLENPQLFEDIRIKEIEKLRQVLSPFLKLGRLSRIECFDIAHLAGVSPTASMVTFIDGVAEKAFYRHFKVYQKKGNDDVSSMKEIAGRRIKHLKDWGEPDLIIVDGGKTQSKVFFDAFEKLEIPVVGLAKRFETFVIPQRIDERNGQAGKIIYKEIRVPEGPVLSLVQRIRNEAHRFARRLHHKLVSKTLIP